MSTREKSQRLEWLLSDMLNKNICPELSSSANTLVFGSGNPNADIVFIGEAPGKAEDEQGLPFVGASGKFLNGMLVEAGMKREDVYITNIVKYRPPNNRDPKPEEKQAFWPYLARQLEIIDPKTIVTLGRHSMEFFLPNEKISEVHGQLFRKVVTPHDGKREKWSIVPLYHPAAALYNGKLREVLMKDFTSAMKYLC